MPVYLESLAIFLQPAVQGGPLADQSFVGDLSIILRHRDQACRDQLFQHRFYLGLQFSTRQQLGNLCPAAGFGSIFTQRG